MTYAKVYDSIKPMLIPQRENKENTYYIEFARWSAFVNASDPKEAATLAFEDVLDKYQNQTEVSAVFTVVDIAKSLKSMDLSDHTTFVYAPEVLSNAGLHGLSNKLKKIIDNLKTKINEQ